MLKQAFQPEPDARQRVVCELPDFILDVSWLQGTDLISVESADEYVMMLAAF